MITATKNTKAFYNTEIPSDWEIVEIGDIMIIKKDLLSKMKIISRKAFVLSGYQTQTQVE
ncbi:hypothetical protein EMGBS15_02850 [Filimonas sp.]|nr:hypothetical protein EMGBS15_02850 [Filimonas sp.]